MPAIREIIDLSHELYQGMPNIGGLPTTFWPVNTYHDQSRVSDGKVESRMMLMAEHCGTHLDAQRHFDENGLSVHEVPLDRLVLPGHLLELTHKHPGEAILPAELEAAAAKTGREIRPGTAICVWTGQNKNWGKGDWITARRYIPTDTAKWLVKRQITLFATDLIGMGDPAQWWLPTHEIWLQANICMVQQLANLDRLVGKEFLFVALPLKMRGGTGCPVTAAASFTDRRVPG